MNYYGAKELAEGFRTVRKNTIAIAEDIGEQHYGFRPAPDTRTVAQVLTHIALSTTFQEQVHVLNHLHTLEGLDFPKVFANLMAEEQKQRTKAQIVSLLRDEGERFAKILEGFSEDFLGERVAMPPGMTPASRTRFDMLLGSKEHEMHHRAQLMVVERILGIVPHLTREMQARMASMTAAKA